LEIGRAFILRTKLNTGLRWRVVDGCDGSNLTLKNYKTRSACQEFYLDSRTRTIIQKQDKKSWDIEGQGKSMNLRLDKTNARWFQQFKFKDGKVIGERGHVVEVEGGKARNGANIIAWKSTSKTQQLWEVIYCDSIPIPKSGELNQEYLLVVDKPFFLVSQLQTGRYLDLIGTNLVLKRRNGFDSQKFFFEQKTQTVKSVMQKDKSWGIQGNGSGKNMEIYTTSGQWFQHFMWDDDAQIIQNHQKLDQVFDAGSDSEGNNVSLTKYVYGTQPKTS